MHAEKLSAARGMSYAEFLDWCDEDTQAEWIDEEVIMASPWCAISGSGGNDGPTAGSRDFGRN